MFPIQILRHECRSSLDKPHHGVGLKVQRYSDKGSLHPVVQDDLHYLSGQKAVDMLDDKKLLLTDANLCVELVA